MIGKKLGGWALVTGGTGVSWAGILLLGTDYLALGVAWAFAGAGAILVGGLLVEDAK